MRQSQSLRNHSGKLDWAKRGRLMLSIAGLVMTSIVPPTTTSVVAAPFSAGSPVDHTVTINCSNAVMTTAPTFLSAPKGSAKYPFSMKCTSPNKPGLMIFSWEGSWNPAETRRDRPNASETLTIIGYEPFLPDRTPGGKLFMYWTGSCTGDPWLQGGSCSRFGEYMPDDLRVAFPNIGSRPFPLTGNSISVGLKQQLINQYQQMNQPSSSRMNNQQQLQNVIGQQQAQSILTQPKQNPSMLVTPPMSTPKIDSTLGSVLGQPRILPRGIEGTETAAGTDEELLINEHATPTLFDEGISDNAEPTVLTLDRALHITTAKGDSAVVNPGLYEIGVVLNLQIGLAREGQPTILMPAHRSQHSESLQRPTAMVIPGQSDEMHIVLMTPDGRRFDAMGSLSGGKPRSVGMGAALADRQLHEAIKAASATPPPLSPPCRPNPADIGPRWIPVPCTMPTVLKP